MASISISCPDKKNQHVCHVECTATCLPLRCPQPPAIQQRNLRCPFDGLVSRCEIRGPHLPRWPEGHSRLLCARWVRCRQRRRWCHHVMMCNQLGSTGLRSARVPSVQQTEMRDRKLTRCMIIRLDARRAAAALTAFNFSSQSGRIWSARVKAISHQDNTPGSNAYSPIVTTSFALELTLFLRIVSPFRLGSETSPESVDMIVGSSGLTIWLEEQLENKPHMW
jgi:hypothetical protein